MKRNILGVSLCGLYVAATAACWIAAYAAAGDPKGHFVLKQLPIAPIAALFEKLGLIGLIKDLSWFGAYALLFPITLGLLYGFGWIVTKSLSSVAEYLAAKQGRQPD